MPAYWLKGLGGLLSWTLMVSGVLYQDHSPRTSRLRQSTFFVNEMLGCSYMFTMQNDLILSLWIN